MVPYWQRAILVALVLAISVPTSTADGSRSRGDPEKYMRDLCSGTQNPDACWKSLNSSLRRLENSSDEDIVKGVLDLARAKSNEIRVWLSIGYEATASNDDNLKKKYHICAIKYYDVHRKLEEVSADLGTNYNYRKGWIEIDESQVNVEDCERQFGQGSDDPGHVGVLNREFEDYLEVVRAATARLEGDRRQGLGPQPALI